ncbi:hypothetical protein LIN78_11240 [Leeia sp. TBRC 13508]|uniref:Uncharacterized protein n=1 Tax=Leeia speluncae TaxID=2884804 RepID=A0ABS8D7E7_9NEIS|nr:hypothetical protein [Leeia speluncae]MCB6184120.1 hypothetical protein [Leeia speluncae]
MKSRSRIGRLWRSAGFALLLCLRQAIAASDYPVGHAAVVKWVNENAVCQATFEAAVTSPHFLQQLKGMGFMLSDLVPPGPPEGVWFVPDGIKVMGYSVNAIHYWSDKGSEFYVEVPEQLSVLRQKYGMQPASTHTQRSDGYHAIKKMMAGNEKQLSTAMFVRPGRGSKMTEIGCRRYART